MREDRVRGRVFLKIGMSEEKGKRKGEEQMRMTKKERTSRQKAS